jgi:hypothetical protein
MNLQQPAEAITGLSLAIAKCPPGQNHASRVRSRKLRSIRSIQASNADHAHLRKTTTR